MTKPVAAVCRLMLVAACLTAIAGLVLLAVLMPFPAMLLGVIAAAVKYRRWQGSGWSHGTARIAEISELAQAGMLGDEGLILGRVGSARPLRWQAMRDLFSRRLSSEAACRLFLSAWLTPRWISNQFIRVRDHVHLITVAPSGAGKGVSAIVPNLLSYRGSCVVTDLKGENFKLTAEHREKILGHRIVRLDPFGECGPGGDSLNPFDQIKADDPDFIELCRELANMLVVRSGEEKEPHWNDSAESIIAAFAAFIAATMPVDSEHRNLQTLRELVSSRERYQWAIAAMQQVEDSDGFMQRLGELLTWFIDRELGSVMTTVNRHTQFLDSPIVKAVTSQSSFDPGLLQHGPVTVYLILPPEKLAVLSPLMRMWIGCIIKSLVKGGASESSPVLFLLDEAAHLGRMKILDDAPALLRGYGIRLWFFFQSLNQMQEAFGEHAKTVLDNIATHQYFAINSSETAEEISRRIGDATISIESQTETVGDSWQTGFGHPQSPGNRSTGRNWTRSETARRLIKPEEILTLPKHVGLIFHKNLPVSLGVLPRYYDAPEFRHGGTGRNRRLGLNACLLAACLLVASGIGLISTASLVEQMQAQQELAGRWQPASPPPAAFDWSFQPYQHGSAAPVGIPPAGPVNPPPSNPTAPLPYRETGFSYQPLTR